jgi:nucleoside phosphorylase
MDPVLDRITFEAKPGKLTPIQWPAGLEPTLHGGHAPKKLPEADVLVLPYTAAEAQAMADVLTPGHPSSSWTKYTVGWDKYVGQLTDRSPARDSKCLGVWAVTTFGEKKVVIFKPDLHLAVDSTSLPVRELIEQVVATVKPELVIDTGTAGGIGPETVLGDVCVTNGAKFNCTGAFKGQSFAQSTYIGPEWTPGPNLQVAAKLLATNAGRLKPVGTRTPVIRTALGVPGIETMDSFGFSDPEDSYGVRKDDPQALNEDMDAAVTWLALGTDTPILSIRNSSDPEVPRMADLEAEKKWASGVYSRFGYWTTVCSAIACWAVIADL